MRYHYKYPDIQIPTFGETYICNHPIYIAGTLFRNGSLGLILIQQRFEERKTFWGPIDACLANDIYVHKDFRKLFHEYAGMQTDGYFPTITVRHAMHWLKMKPLKKERWETCFDRTII